jgi:hypothetical protein
MVHTHHKHGGISRRGRDYDPFGSTLQVSLCRRNGLHTQAVFLATISPPHILGCTKSQGQIAPIFSLPAPYPSLLHGSEDSSGFHDVLSTSITPFDVGGISPMRGTEKCSRM